MALIVIVYYKGSGFKVWEPVVMLLAFGLPMGIYVVRNLIVTGKVTSYVGEFRDYSMKVTFPILKHRAKVYIWNGMSDALFSALFLLGSVWLLVRKKWKAFLVVVGWFALFAGFHLFWYYAYERFMAPAVPAVGLVIGFVFVDLAGLSWALFKTDGWFARKVLRLQTARTGAELDGTGVEQGVPRDDAQVEDPEAAGAPPASGSNAPPLEGRRMARHGTRISSGQRAGLRAAQVACLVVLAVFFAFMTWHGLARADAVIKENYKAFSDDHGGVAGMKKAAEWLDEHAPAQLVAADAGPMFTWLYYPGDVLLMRPVPWDLPVEQADIAYVEAPRRLYERGVRYLVVGQTEKGVDDELQLFGIVGSNRPYIKEVARWTTHYDFPTPHDLDTVIFEVLPPG